MPASPIAVINFDLAYNIEITTKVPTIGKGCQEIGSHAALQIEHYGLASSAGRSRAGDAEPIANDVLFCS
jgi:hypothetical protein